MSNMYDYEITGLSEEAQKLSAETRAHIWDEAVALSGIGWLPAVYSEDDETLRAILVNDLGQPVESGYMSEECGWEVTEYIIIDEAVALSGNGWLPAVYSEDVALD